MIAAPILCPLARSSIPFPGSSKRSSQFDAQSPLDDLGLCAIEFLPAARNRDQFCVLTKVASQGASLEFDVAGQSDGDLEESRESV